MEGSKQELPKTPVLDEVPDRHVVTSTVCPGDGNPSKERLPPPLVDRSLVFVFILLKSLIILTLPLLPHDPISGVVGFSWRYYSVVRYDFSPLFVISVSLVVHVSRTSFYSNCTHPLWFPDPVPPLPYFQFFLLSPFQWYPEHPGTSDTSPEKFMLTF